MKAKVFIDGREGTTGLQIEGRLKGRGDIEQITIDAALRKDAAARKEMLNAADIVFLCLPDDAARQAVTMIENKNTRVIDASTAHRTANGWLYGFPELWPAKRSEWAQAARVANPGCHATGFLAIVAPLVAAGLLPKEAVVTCYSLTGYSGGGKQMIAEYEAPDRRAELSAPRIYGLALAHKHLPEMTAHSGLSNQPLFIPVVDDYYAGMAVSILLHKNMLAKKAAPQDLRDALAAHFEGARFVKVPPLGDQSALETPGFIGANKLEGSNNLEILTFGGGGGDQTLLVARFDNLGKGASGAAVQNMNIMLGLDEAAGL